METPRIDRGNDSAFHRYAVKYSYIVATSYCRSRYIFACIRAQAATRNLRDQYAGNARVIKCHG